MFTRRKALDRRRLYTREYFQSLVQQLSDAGFDSIKVILPHNYPSVDTENSAVSIDEFLERGRNFAAIILTAESTEKSELLKVLFVNSDATAAFVDDTFPSVASEPPSLFFQSPDPARAYALFEYFYDNLSKGRLGRFVFSFVMGIISMFMIVAEIASVVVRKQGILGYNFGAAIFLDVALGIGSVWMAFNFFKQPSGLWIKPRRDIRFLYLIKMAIRGELRDNPFVQIVITIVGSVLAMVLLKWMDLI